MCPPGHAEWGVCLLEQVVGLTDTRQTTVCDESCRVGRGQSKRSEGACDSGEIWSCSTGGDDSIPKLTANGHQQSIEQCTAAHARVPLTGLCQSVNTALANYNLTACNLRLSKLCRRSITLPPLSRSTPWGLGSGSVWRSPVSQSIPSLSWFLGSRHFSLIQGIAVLFTFTFLTEVSRQGWRARAST